MSAPGVGVAADVAAQGTAPPRRAPAERERVAVVTGEQLLSGAPACSPLHPERGYAGALSWAGPVDEAEGERIAARVAYGALPWWARLVTGRPVGWTS